MTFSLHPYSNNVPSQDEDVFDPLSNFWFQIDTNISFNSFIESYKDCTTEYLFIDCSRSYPLTSDFGFLKDLMGRSVTSKHLIKCSFFIELQRIWNELKISEMNEWDIRDKIYRYFKEIYLECQVIVFVFPDLHLIANDIRDKEIHILNNISSTSNCIKFWIISDTRVDTNNSKLRDKFFSSFKSANELQKVTFFRYANYFNKHSLEKQNVINTEIGMERIKLFISYAHADEKYKDRFVELLKDLTISGLIEEWNDQYLIPGKKWDKEIKRKLEESQIVLFLISEVFLKSDYINDVEIKNTLVRYERNEVLIVSIILEECDFGNSSLNEYQALPKGALPISKWKPEIDAWLSVINGLKKSIDYLKNSKKVLTKKVQELKEGSIIINQSGENNINIVNNSGPINFSR